MKKKFDKVYIEITNVCNLACEFCPQGKRKKEFMPVENFTHILKQISPFTNMVMLHVKGEPLLHPNLEEILKQCKVHGISVTITTNGTLLKEKLTILKEADGLRQVNISLHSFTQNNKKQEDYLKNVFEVADELKQKVYISYRLWNLENFEDNQENEEILNCLAKHYEIQDLLEKAKNNAFLKLYTNVFLNQDRQFTWPEKNGKEYGKCGTCYGLRKQLSILANGDVVPCCMDAEGELKLGNIFAESLEEILNSNRAKNIVEGFQKRELVEPFCRTCGFIRDVRGRTSNIRPLTSDLRPPTSFSKNSLKHLTLPMLSAYNTNSIRNHQEVA